MDSCKWACIDAEHFDLCGECFASGVEIGDHTSDHSYTVTDNLGALQLLEGSDWGADEELLLLEGVEKCGLGNWVDALRRVERRRH